RLAGAFAFDALRVERGFRSWGHDMGGLDDPYAVGLGFAVRGDKQEFVGKQALAVLKDSRRDRELVSVKLDDPGPMLWHGEPVVMGTDRIGYVTSGAYGHHLGAAVGVAWIHGVMTTDLPVSVEVRGTRVRATISREPFWRPYRIISAIVCTHRRSRTSRSFARSGSRNARTQISSHRAHSSSRSYSGNRPGTDSSITRISRSRADGILRSSRAVRR